MQKQDIKSIGFAYGMIKQAYEDKEQKKNQHRLAGYLGGTVAGAAGAGVAGGASLGLMGSIGKSLKDDHIPEGRIDALKKHMGLNTSINHADGLNAANFNPLTNTANFDTQKGNGIAAHELGHAMNYRGNEKKFLALRNGGMIGGGLIGSGMATFGDVDGKAVRFAPLVTAAGTMPTLIDEAVASVRGYKALKAVGASTKELQVARKALTKAFSTYGLNALATVGGTAAISGLRIYLRKKDLANKQQGH